MTNEIRLLPVNSFELEQHLTDVGLSLLTFANEYKFSEKCVGVRDCDFIQSVLIEFTSEIKVDFIAYHAIHKARVTGIRNAAIVASEHGPEVLAEAAIHAQQAGITTNNADVGLFFTIRYALRGIKKRLVNAAYQQKVRARQKQTQTVIPRADPGQFKVLMSTFHPSTIFTLTPVQDRLNKMSDIHQVYIANRYETHEKLVSMGYKNVISAWGVKKSKNYSVSTGVLKKFVNDYFERNFPFGEATTHFRSRFYRTLKQKLNFAVSLYGPIKEIINIYQPNTLLISSCSTTDAQIMIYCAKDRKINVVEMTHGMFQDTPLLKFQHVPVKLVWCKRQHDVMKKYAPSIECPVIGNPKHDELKEKFEKSPPKSPYMKPFILFASTPGNNISISWNTYVEILQVYIRVANNFPELIFLWKLHPSESKTKVLEVAEKLGAKENFIVEKEAEIYPLLFTAEIVVVLTSSVGFEALLWDKKLITYTLPNSDNWLPFSQYGLVRTASDESSLSESVKYFLENPSLTLANEHKDYFVLSDGKALDRILSFTLKVD
jgi:hypothetical protein